MPNDDVRAIAERTIRHFGAKHQLAKLIEELGELTTEAALGLVGRLDVTAFAKECADVEIVLEQMRVLMGDELIDRHKRSADPIADSFKAWAGNQSLLILIKELSKLTTEAARELVGRPDRDLFAKGCGDVERALDRMRFFFGDALIEAQKQIKLKRLVDVYLLDALP